MTSSGRQFDFEVELERRYANSGKSIVQSFDIHFEYLRLNPKTLVLAAVKSKVLTWDCGRQTLDSCGLVIDS